MSGKTGKVDIQHSKAGPGRARTWHGPTAGAAARVLGFLALGLGAGLVLASQRLARGFLTLPPDRRRPLLQNPGDYGLNSEDVQVTTADGLVLRGWYMPGRNGATIMVQHGTPGGRQDGLPEAAFFNKRGYNVLLGSFRAHDDCDGQDVSYGYREVRDARAWHGYLLDRPEVNRQRIGIFGQSMGGCVAIQFAAENPAIAAVAAAAAPAVMAEAAAHILAREFPLLAWSAPALTRFFIFWAERKVGYAVGETGALPFVGQISPRPLLIIHGGDDRRVPPAHGRLLYDAAGQPKELWFIEEAGHGNFVQCRPAEYKRRLLAFFDGHLLGGEEDYRNDQQE